MLKTIDAIIFDMDGVLVDSEPVHIETEKITCRAYGIKVPESAWEGFKGTTDQDMFDYIVKNFTDGKVSIDELVAHRAKTYLRVTPEKIQTMIPGALEFLKQVKEQRLKIALTTSSINEVQESIFDKFNLHAYFNVIVTADEIIKGKPDPEPYLKTVQKLQLPAGHCLVIEDSTNGILSAKAAGCIAAGITNSFSKERLCEAGADYVVNTFKELSHLLFPTIVKKRR